MAGFGLKITRSSGPSGFVGNMSEYPISPSNTAPIFKGDLVRLASGFIVEATGAADNDDFSPLGVFEGCRYVAADGSYVSSPYWDGVAGRTNIVAVVANAQTATFLVKGDTAGTYTQASIGLRFGVAYTVGSTVYGDSRCNLAAAASATGPLFLHRLVDSPRNAFSVDEPLFEVSIIRPQGFNALI